METDYKTYKRQALVSECCKRFGKDASVWAFRSSKDAMIVALETGVAPACNGNGNGASHAPVDGAELMAKLAEYFSANAKPAVDVETVEAIVDNRIAGIVSPTVTVKVADAPAIEIERQHYLFPLVLTLCANRVHCYLCGPAGSFKTSIAKSVSKALGLPFGAKSASGQNTEASYLGFMQPQLSGPPVYVPTLFRKMYEHGGVFLWDEIDNGNANVSAVINMALANGEMAFPDGMVAKHPDFVLIAAANTYGTGASRVYVGRNQLDGATLDRFAFVDLPYDEALESTLAGVPMASEDCNLDAGFVPSAQDWISFVQSVRRAVATLKERVVISPRATFYGVKLAAAGIGRAWLEKMLVWKGIETGTVEKIKQEIASHA